jgi:gluconokinase
LGGIIWETLGDGDMEGFRMNIVVMGVCGTGKSSVGALLAERLGATFLEGDSFHSSENVAAMASGKPLTDAMREPWLRAISDEMHRLSAAGQDTVVTCSALKKAYRDTLRTGAHDVVFVYLSGERATILDRMTSRPGHFMPASLLDSQLATLEVPSKDERAIEVSIDQPLEAMVEVVVRDIERSNLPDPAKHP